MAALAAAAGSPPGAFRTLLHLTEAHLVGGRWGRCTSVQPPQLCQQEYDKLTQTGIRPPESVDRANRRIGRPNHHQAKPRLADRLGKSELDDGVGEGVT